MILDDNVNYKTLATLLKNREKFNEYLYAVSKGNYDEVYGIIHSICTEFRESINQYYSIKEIIDEFSKISNISMQDITKVNVSIENSCSKIFNCDECL